MKGKKGLNFGWVNYVEVGDVLRGLEVLIKNIFVDLFCRLYLMFI